MYIYIYIHHHGKRSRRVFGILYLPCSFFFGVFPPGGVGVGGMKEGGMLRNFLLPALLEE